MADQCPPLRGHINKENLKKHLQSHYIHKHHKKPKQRTPGYSTTPQTHQADHSSTPPGHHTDSDGWTRVWRSRVRSDHHRGPDPPARHLNPPHHPHPHQPTGRRDSDLTPPGEERRRTHPPPPYHTLASRHDSSRPDPYHHHPYTLASTPPPHPSSRSYRRGACFRCGETNHSQKNCRFDHKVRCTACYRLGHKSKLCNHYSK